MATDTQKYDSQIEQEPRHSALAEFGRDERRPAVLLLSALLLSALFFGLGLMIGRWTALPESTHQAASTAPQSSASTTASKPQPATPAATNTASETQPNDTTPRRFALLIATYDAPEKAQALIKALQQSGYTDIRTRNPRAGETRPTYSVLAGRFTQDEAREAARRMRATNDPRLRNAKVIEASDDVRKAEGSRQ